MCYLDHPLDIGSGLWLFTIHRAPLRGTDHDMGLQEALRTGELDVNEADDNECTPLHLAILKGTAAQHTT